MTQGPWTRIRPLQPAEVDDHTASALRQAELTWGHFPNNLAKTLAHCPALAIAAVPYANSFIFDIDVFNNGRMFAGFLDRPLKELCINRTSLLNRSRYSVTHHSFIAYSLYKALGREAEGQIKLLHLHEHERHRDLYTRREAAALDYTVKVAGDPHEVTDELFAQLRRSLEEYNRGRAQAALTEFDREFIKKWVNYSDGQHAALVDSQLVELTWLVGHFCLLNRWFTALQVPDEGPQDEADFTATYRTTVPGNIRDRNEVVLQRHSEPARDQR